MWSKFEDLKSKYILIKIFDLLTKKKSLEIIHYNKKLQKRSDLTINDYKEYFQLLIYSSIEIELKLVDNKYEKFINIADKENEYYHIYFDNSNKEIKRNYLNKNENIEKIKIIIDHHVKSFKYFFEECKCINREF